MAKKEQQPKVHKQKVYRPRKPITIKRYVSTIFIVLGLIWVASAVYYVNNNVLTFKDDPTYESQAQSKASLVNFDQDTIAKLKALQARQATDSNTLPAGRNNPFAP